MIDFLLSLSTWAGCLIAMGLTAVVGFVVYLVSYELISKYQREDMQDPTSNLFRVVGTPRQPNVRTGILRSHRRGENNP